MKRHNFAISYDISDAKRLRKVAKCLEQHAFRIQKSLFFYPKASKKEIENLIFELEKIIDEKEDDVRIYHIDIKNSISLKNAVDLKSFYCIL